MNFSIWFGATFPEVPPEVAREAIGALIRASGDLVTITPIPGKPASQTRVEFTLRELQEYVGGYAEVVPFNHGYIVIDEDGKLKGRVPNKLANERIGHLIRKDDHFVGDVLVCCKKAIA